MKYYIAVLSNDDRDFRALFASSDIPNVVFVKVRTENDIRGREFIGHIKSSRWYNIENVHTLLELIKQRTKPLK